MSSLPLPNQPMVRNICWVFGVIRTPPHTSLLFLKLLLCRKVSEMSLRRDPWVTIMLARGREKRGRET